MGQSVSLHKIAKHGNHVQLAEELNRDAAHINTPHHHHHDSTALHTAVKHGHQRCVQVLVLYGADPSCQDIDGNTPLHTAVIHKHLLCFAELRQLPRIRRTEYLSRVAGALAVRNKAGQTVSDLVQLLHDELLEREPITARSWSLELKGLNELAADGLSLTEPYFVNILKTGEDIGKLQRYFANDPALLSKRIGGLPPAHVAALYGHVDVVDALVVLLGEDTVYASRAADGSNMLHAGVKHFAETRHLETLQELLSRHCSEQCIHMTNDNGDRPGDLLSEVLRELPEDVSQGPQMAEVKRALRVYGTASPPPPSPKMQVGVDL